MGLLNIFKRKQTNNQLQQMYLYTEEELDQYEKFIESQFGEYTEVFHEIYSPDIHADVIIVPPTPEHNFYKLITMGMGAYPMNVPEELSQYELERAELILYLPPDWDIKSNKEEDYWPIRMQKILARLPIDCNTWLGYGHTVSKDADNTPFADNTGFCSVMLLSGLNLELEKLDLRIDTLGKINFYQIFPIYEEELVYKESHDANALIDLFDDEDVNPIINIERKNYGKL